MTDPSTRTLRVDIVSDVVCPWCVVGWRQLERAASSRGVELDVHWHPFELNPTMADEGEELREHLARKYGTTLAGSQAARKRLDAFGEEVGFTFEWDDEMRIVPTFRAHQLLHWADTHGLEHALKQALFDRYFTRGGNVNDPEVLVEAAGSVGLDADEAREVLADRRFADVVREREAVWRKRGVNGVPAMFFDETYMTSGAQGEETFGLVIDRVLDGPRAEQRTV